MSLLESGTVSAPISTIALQPTLLAIPTTTSAPEASQQESRSTLSIAQHQFCLSTIHSLKKMNDAILFIGPVDIGSQHSPPPIIVTPMYFSTIDRKLVTSHPITSNLIPIKTLLLPNHHVFRYRIHPCCSCCLLICLARCSSNPAQ